MNKVREPTFREMYGKGTEFDCPNGFPRGRL